MINYAYKSANPFRASDEDLTYSDFETNMDKHDKLRKKLREFGVSTYVVDQLYPQRGMTIGDLTGHNSNHEQHSNGDDDTGNYIFNLNFRGYLCDVTTSLYCFSDNYF